ncbi:hypothetical protein BJX66DRAFT_290660 [Aspergillus keveii]|uniref:Uncharacterized protein n=1 Tax=Aspergillus keveii TaxID=714993 RepID=A0ABR4GPP7_9EURO
MFCTNVVTLKSKPEAARSEWVQESSLDRRVCDMVERSAGRVNSLSFSVGSLPRIHGQIR